MYVCFGRRAEGVKSLRGIFGKARRDCWIPWEVYQASGLFLSLLFLSFNNQPFFIIVALMEYHCSDDRSVASRIFEKGLDYFGDEIDYVLCYLSVLISINDKNSKPLVISHFTYTQTSNIDAMPSFSDA
jgi:cleavage stimulation factor subunit 3